LHLFSYICNLSDFGQTIDSKTTSGGLSAWQALVAVNVPAKSNPGSVCSQSLRSGNQVSNQYYREADLGLCGAEAGGPGMANLSAEPRPGDLVASALGDCDDNFGWRPSMPGIWSPAASPRRTIPTAAVRPRRTAWQFGLAKLLGSLV
jgi:hypothetical protein